MEHTEIRCFQHCSTDKNVFCMQLPNTCPLCFDKLTNCEFLVPPFCLPSPFHYHLATLLKYAGASCKPIGPCSVVVKPTNGHFFSSYSPGDDLHIGLTDSDGVVFGFTEEGVSVEQTGWDCCLCVNIIHKNEIGKELARSWDALLRKSKSNDNWSKSRYHVTNYNCYTYAINILSGVFQAPITKRAFCEMHLLPVTTRAAKYLRLCRDLQEQKVVVRDIRP